MMYQRIYDDFIQARRDRDSLKAGLLGTLIGEAQNQSPTKEITDSTMLAVVQKFIKNGKIAIDNGSIQSAQEAPILEAYLPQQLTVEQLRNHAMVHSSMQSYMNYLKSNHAGQYDGKTAAQVWNNKELTT